jgi:SAM-dependent methyltransferase
MTVAYQVMYRMGFTPWEHEEIAEPLRELVAQLPAGALLDVGCGTGRDVVYCATQGWRATGIDAVSTPLRRARRRAEAAAVPARFLHLDIARAGSADLGVGYTLINDIGCFGGLPEVDKRRAASTLTEVAAPGAVLLMFAFADPGRTPIGPKHALEPSDLATLFPAWDVDYSRDAADIQVGGPMRHARRYWHQLVRRSRSGP